MGTCEHRGIGKRDAHVMDRNARIEKAAMDLAAELRWPSPAAVARRSGISVSVVGREIARLNKARRHWVRNAGRDHPQWKDPVDPSAQQAAGTAAATAGQRASTDAALSTPARKAGIEDGVATSTGREREKRLRRENRQLKVKITALEEEVRRLLKISRPSELDAILKAGTK